VKIGSIDLVTEPVWRQIFRNSSCLAMLPAVAGIVGILLAITLRSELFRMLFSLLCLVLFLVLAFCWVRFLCRLLKKNRADKND